MKKAMDYTAFDSEVLVWENGTEGISNDFQFPNEVLMNDELDPLEEGNNKRIFDYELIYEAILNTFPKMTKQAVLDFLWVGMIFWILFFVPRILTL